MSGRSNTRLFWADLFVCGLGPLLMLIQLILLSPTKYFWADESLTLLLVRDVSFGQMLDALKDTINAFPPTYFCLIWFWTRVFGLIPRCVAGISSVCLAAIWILLWFMLRSTVSRLSAAAALVAGLLLARQVRMLNIEAQGI